MLNNWEEIENAFETMVQKNKQVLFTLEHPQTRQPKEYFVWTVEDEEIMLLPLESQLHGALFELIPTNDNDLVLTFDFSIDATEQVAAAILDQAQHIPVICAETEAAKINEDLGEPIVSARYFKLGDTLPASATGKTLRYNGERFSFEYED